jgi:hypothetical protein
MMTIDEVWARIVENKDGVFRMANGGQFCYRVFGDRIYPSLTRKSVSRASFEKALPLMPVKGPTELKEKGVSASTHIYALLTDPRIVG